MHIKNVNEVVLCWITDLNWQIKGSKTGNYFFENVMDYLTVQVLDRGRRMRKPLGETKKLELDL